MVKSQVMKQFSALLATLVACLLFSLPSGAQGKHEINLYMSGACSEYLSLNTPRDYTMDLYGLYETQVRYIQSGPGLTLEYNYALLNWLVLGGQFNYHRVIWDQYSRVGGNRANYTNTKNKVALLPQAIPWCLPGTWCPSAANGAGNAFMERRSWPTAVSLKAAVSALVLDFNTGNYEKSTLYPGHRRYGRRLFQREPC